TGPRGAGSDAPVDPRRGGAPPLRGARPPRGARDARVTARRTRDPALRRRRGYPGDARRRTAAWVGTSRHGDTRAHPAGRAAALVARPRPVRAGRAAGRRRPNAARAAAVGVRGVSPTPRRPRGATAGRLGQGRARSGARHYHRVPRQTRRRHGQPVLSGGARDDRECGSARRVRVHSRGRGVRLRALAARATEDCRTGRARAHLPARPAPSRGRDRRRQRHRAGGGAAVRGGRGARRSRRSRPRRRGCRGAGDRGGAPRSRRRHAGGRPGRREPGAPHTADGGRVRRAGLPVLHGGPGAAVRGSDRHRTGRSPAAARRPLPRRRPGDRRRRGRDATSEDRGLDRRVRLQGGARAGCRCGGLRRKQGRAAAGVARRRRRAGRGRYPGQRHQRGPDRDTDVPPVRRGARREERRVRRGAARGLPPAQGHGRGAEPGRGRSRHRRFVGERAIPLHDGRHPHGRRRVAGGVPTLTPLRALTRDGWLLFLTRVTRLFAYGSLSVVLVFYLTSLGLSASQTGILLTLTLAGDVAVSLYLTTRADRIGRRRMLIVGAILMAAAGLAFACTKNLLLLIIAGTIGVISPSGNEVGPFFSIEQAALSHVVSQRSRTEVFAWYTLTGSVATAMGALFGGTVTHALQRSTLTPVGTYRVVVVLYAVLGVMLAYAFTRLSPAAEVSLPQEGSALPGTIG